MTTCPRCNGDGCEPGTSRVIQFRSNTGFYTQCINCEQCNGDGKVMNLQCKNCKGTGIYEGLYTPDDPNSGYVKEICEDCDGKGVYCYRGDTAVNKQPSANDRQEGADHYRKVLGEQHWDRLVRLYGLDVAFVYFVGNITAYVERYRDKNGIEDLKKARHYIDKLIELEEAHEAEPKPPTFMEAI